MKNHKINHLCRQLLSLFLVLIISFTASGCSLTRVFDGLSTEYIEEIQNPDTSQTDNEAFDSFVNQLFQETITSDTVTLHSFLENPANYGISDYNVTLGGYDLNQLDNTTDITDTLTALNAFSRDSLSEKQQISFDQLKNYLETQLEYSDLYLLDSQLSTTIGIQVQLPIVFAEYSFKQKKDIDEYLLLIQDTDEYFTNMVDYEKLRAAKGYFMEDSLADKIIEQCQTFIDTASNGYLITTFDQKIDVFSGLTDEEKAAYKTANADAISNHMVKAYATLKEGLTALKGSNKYAGGLCNYPDGGKYFEYLLKNSLGWDKTVAQYDAMLDSYLATYMRTMQLLSSKNPSLLDQYDSFTFSLTDPSGILEDLKKRIPDDYPSIENVNYEVKYIDKALQDYASPAMYFTPQIDNLSENSIYINPSGNNGNELFPTLAHEGYPGHLYQTQYFASTNPDLIRYLIEPGGYVEGWATYVEVASYNYAQTDNAPLNSLMSCNYATILCLYGKIDIGVNYYDWTESDVFNFISSYGFTDQSIAHDMYSSMVSEPGNYSKYVLGFLGFNELKKEAQNKLGDAFNLKEFHKYVLDFGPVPFDMLFSWLDAWVEKAQYK